MIAFSLNQNHVRVSVRTPTLVWSCYVLECRSIQTVLQKTKKIVPLLVVPSTARKRHTSIERYPAQQFTWRRAGLRECWQPRLALHLFFQHQQKNTRMKAARHVQVFFLVSNSLLTTQLLVRNPCFVPRSADNWKLEG